MGKSALILNTLNEILDRESTDKNAGESFVYNKTKGSVETLNKMVLILNVWGNTKMVSQHFIQYSRYCRIKCMGIIYKSYGRKYQQVEIYSEVSRRNTA